MRAQIVSLFLGVDLTNELRQRSGLVTNQIHRDVGSKESESWCQSRLIVHRQIVSENVMLTDEDVT